MSFAARYFLALALASAAPFLGCSSKPTQPPASQAVRPEAPAPPPPQSSAPFLGFDRNEYPGDDTMAAMHAKFSFTGYWLTVPPGAQFNQWQGKRETLRKQGWGFLVLANGKLEKEILAAKKSGTTPAVLAQRDAAAAVSAARSEGFPAHTILFLDQEEGGRLTDPQAAYLLAWTEAVAASDFAPGVYASGQPVPDDPGTVITTIRDIRDRVQKKHLHDIAIFDTQDECPPAPGCVMQPPSLSDAGEPSLTAWQYSQSPRRPPITRSCAATYAKDGNCYAVGFPSVFLDLDSADTPDPSHGR